MYSIVLMIHVGICLGLIAFVLLQQGKGAGMGGLGGGGNSASLFTSTDTANFMTHTTALLATGFFITSLILSLLAVNQVKAQRAAQVAPINFQSNPNPTVQDNEIPVDQTAGLGE